MNIRAPILILSFYLFSIFTSAISVYFNSSSIAFGLACSMSVFITLGLLSGFRFKIPLRMINLIFNLMFFILLHYVLQSILNGKGDYERFLLSLVFITMQSIVAFLFARAICDVRDEIFNKTVYCGFYFLLFVGYISLALQFFEHVENKSMIIFSEPSHFAISFLPFLLYVVLKGANKFSRLIYICLSFILGLSVNNLTIIVGALVITFVLLLKLRLLYPYLIAIFVFIFAINFINVDYFSDRLDFFGSGLNLSTLVFLSGWERAYSEFMSSYGFGIGLQQLGISSEVGNYQNLIMLQLGGDNLNLFDGGSLAPKIVAEFGVVGLLFLGAYIFFCIVVLKEIVSLRKQRVKDLFFFSVFIMFSIEIFVRGMGYFSIGSFMFMSALYWIFYNSYFVDVELRQSHANLILKNKRGNSPFYPHRL